MTKCLDIERAQALIRDLEANREIAISEESPPDTNDVDAEFIYEATSEFYRENRGPLGPVKAGLDEILAPPRLFVYCRIFHGVPVYAPYMERFYLVGWTTAGPSSHWVGGRKTR